MLAAISTTILSSRSCALTGSAMTSRSRRNSTRGPPSAPRIGVSPRGWLEQGGSSATRRKSRPRAGHPRTHHLRLSPQMPMQTASQRAGREARKVSRVRHNPVVLSLPIRRGCAVRRMLALGILVVAVTGVAGPLTCNSGGVAPCRRGPSGAEKVRPSPIPARAPKRPGIGRCNPIGTTCRSTCRGCCMKSNVGRCEAISGPRTRSRNCSIHQRRSVVSGIAPTNPPGQFVRPIGSPPAERDAQRDGRNPGWRGPNV